MLTLPRLRSKSTGKLIAPTSRVAPRIQGRTGRMAQAAVSAAIRSTSQTTVAVSDGSVARGVRTSASGGA